MVTYHLHTLVGLMIAVLLFGTAVGYVVAEPINLWVDSRRKIKAERDMAYKIFKYVDEMNVTVDEAIKQMREAT